MKAGGTLRPAPMPSDQHPGGDSLCFADATGEEVLRYTGLKAWDVAGRALPARLEARGNEVAVLVDDERAVYPIMIDPLFANVESRLLPGVVEHDHFGAAVALDGDIALVGAPRADTAAGVDAGSAYLFQRRENVWSFFLRLEPDAPAARELFGSAVALSGERALVGAPGNGSVAFRAGSAYVFVRTTETWEEEAMLVADDGATADEFGFAVALEGGVALVGAPRHDVGAEQDAGAAYVFVRGENSWPQHEALTAEDPQRGDEFGEALALEGGTAVIGAPLDDTGAGASAGSVHVFVREGAGWDRQAVLIGGDDEERAGDRFGDAVAIWGDSIVVGAPAERTPSPLQDAGGAYVFVRSEGEWRLQDRLHASDPMRNDEFAGAVAIEGDIVLVGTWKDDPTLPSNPGVYVFVRNGEQWSEEQQFKGADSERNDIFGRAIAISGDSALIGAWKDDTEAGEDAGSAYVFRRQGAQWVEQTRLTADDDAAGDKLGSAVAISGDTAVVGVPDDDTAGKANAGSAYVFVRNDGLWSEQAKLTGSDPSPFDLFGAAVALDGDTALVGAPDADPPRGSAAGKAHVFVRRGSRWIPQAVLLAGDGEQNDRFGSAVALSSSRALVGAPFDETAAGRWAGSAYLFERDEEGWKPGPKLTTGDDETFALDQFGTAVALDGDTALIGAPRDDTIGARAGGAYVYVRGEGGDWTRQAHLTTGDGAFWPETGTAVALSGDTAVLGAPCDDPALLGGAGSAYVFVREGSIWSQQAKLTAIDAAGSDEFGISVAVSEGRILVGAWKDNTSAGSNSGSVYAFVREDGLWRHELQLTSGVDASADDLFGSSVALDGNLAVVGAQEEDLSGSNAGSAYAFLLGELPEITVQPVSQTVVEEEAVTFRVEATGHGPLRYRWRRNGSLIEGDLAQELEGVDAPTLTIPSAQTLHQGNYDCVVSNIGGVVTSAAATLTVNNLSQFAQSFPPEPVEARGVVIVSLTPDDIGAGWRFAGERPWRASGSLASGLTTSVRTIEFRPVPGYETPAVVSVPILSGAAPIFLERTYDEDPVEGMGALRVTLEPVDLAGAAVPEAGRAQWRLRRPGHADNPWLDSGEMEEDLTPGEYEVESKWLEGWIQPPLTRVTVRAGETTPVLLSYRPAPPGEAPEALPFETVWSSEDRPYAWVGQLRNAEGSATGFVVKERVVVTAAHAVFDGENLCAETDVEWLFQEDRGSYESEGQTPRGYCVLSGYDALWTPGSGAGTSTPAQQERDVAALWFLEAAGRGGFSGFLASNGVPDQSGAGGNEWLRSDAEKVLVGYPVDGVAPDKAGRMHATEAANLEFTPAGSAHTYKTSGVRALGGNSGGPLCVRFEDGGFYPAAILVASAGQAVVRAIDGEVVELINQAELESNGGDEVVGGGISLSVPFPLDDTPERGVLEVKIEPAEARASGAGWRFSSESSYRSPALTGTLDPGVRTLQFKPVSGFVPPAEEQVEIVAGTYLSITYTYVRDLPEEWRLEHFGTTENLGEAGYSADPDRDGSPNHEEYAAGTDPNDREEAFGIVSIRREGVEVVVEVEGRAGRRYELERFDAGNGAYGDKPVDEVGPLDEDGAVILTDGDNPAEAAIYRVRVSVP